MFSKDDSDDQAKQPGSPARWRLVPLLPLRDIVVFPHMVVPLFVGREKSVKALEEAMNKEKEILLAAQKKAKTDNPVEEDIYRIGTLGTIVQLLRLPDGTVKLLAEGKRRARIRQFMPEQSYFLVEAEEIAESSEVTLESEALMRSLKGTFDTYVKLNRKVPTELVGSVSAVTDPGRLADTIVAHLELKITDKQRILEIEQPVKRLEELFTLIQAEVEVLQVERKIRSRVKKQMEKTQKEYYLNEQMRAIQKELGDRDEFKSEIQELDDKIKKKKLSNEAAAKVKKEVRKLKMMSPMSAEATVVRNYIDWILSLPWHEYTDEKHDVNEAERVLDEDHYGLEKVKERVLEYLAVQSLVKQMKGPILCFVGPPGVGKTSLARSIARATGRSFVRISLGGVRDEAEIRGHRRTYIGALPGKIVQCLKKAGSSNPVFLLDEVDKMSTDFRGDPSSALLEVLDPEQNYTFNDHYLDLDYDLSRVMFITTANQLHEIPRPLQDRMEIIRIAGYTEHEKMNIAKGFLVKKQLEANGLQDQNISFTDNALLEIVRRYTRESGVRSLERELASVYRKIARELVQSKNLEREVKVTASAVGKFLGVAKFRYGRAEESAQVGLATGLAWTDVGGELLTTEVAVTPGKGKLTITGKLGDVMQESAHAAMSYIRSRAAALGLEKDFYAKVDIHVHVPEGAVPKDGPSAGITMATAIASALLKIPVRSDLAMTGEITLRGRVLPIGGLKEKILAAHRGGIKRILIPGENAKDLGDIPAKILKAVDVGLVDHMDDVLREALVVDDPDTLLKPGAAFPEGEGGKPVEPTEPGGAGEQPPQLN
ncbi:MAG: endopeptidase La [Deltaproteobacteria bacterium]|nr:endopeptidase La [Deltaproteobacteria bacterium]